jgi:NAD(P)H-quinone oxidoreductase subunit 5
MTLPDAALLAAAAPLLHVLAAIPALAGVSAARAWRIAEACALSAAVLAAGAGVLALGGEGRADPAGQVVGLLVAVLGAIVVRYARRYLAGEPRQRTFVAALMLTLGAVGIVVLADHLGVLVAAWIASSLALHHLLLFYPDRVGARIAAHKKFLSNRLSELCMVVALGLVWSDAGTLSITALAAQVAGDGQASVALQAAAALFAVAAILRCALLPVHGWLIQVMEAPTPVSALLHAGVVNLGGFVMIRLGVLLAESPLAQFLLVVAGAASAVLAGLVMMTRVSIKVRLAWSTCAQMGFMLMQCGLGLHALALLHLVGHSIYKARAFLRAGDTVLDARREALAPRPVPRPPQVRALVRLAAAPVAVALLAASALGWQWLLPGTDTPWIVLLVAGLGLAPLLWQAEDRGLRGALGGGAAVLALAQLYLATHHLFGPLVPAASDAATAQVLAIGVGAMFVLLYVLQAWLLVFPRGALSRRLYPGAFAGFWLDEAFTRFAFRAWPLRLPQPGVALPSTTAGERA